MMQKGLKAIGHFSTMNNLTRIRAILYILSVKASLRGTAMIWHLGYRPAMGSYSRIIQRLR